MQREGHIEIPLSDLFYSVCSAVVGPTNNLFSTLFTLIYEQKPSKYCSQILPTYIFCKVILLPREKNFLIALLYMCFFLKENWYHIFVDFHSAVQKQLG